MGFDGLPFANSARPERNLAVLQVDSEDAGHLVRGRAFFRPRGSNVEVHPLDHLLHVRALHGGVLKFNEARFAVQIAGCSDNIPC